jgi:prepilin-type N-terminal cleavage/methylation domain-containing protein
MKYGIFKIGGTMKKGFTLVELLGVIVILGIIALLTFPPIINQIKRLRESSTESTQKLIFSAADKFLNNNKNEYPMIEDYSYCISLKTLIEDGVLNSHLLDSDTGEKIPETYNVLVKINSGYVKTFSLKDENGCGYIDISGAKAPELANNMIPVEYIDNKWTKANLNSEWYNYEQKRWANAVLVTFASRPFYRSAPEGTEILNEDILVHLVWIPAYRYKINNTTSSAITKRNFEILFEGAETEVSTGNELGSWISHPAFQFGADKVNGFWVTKFEIGYLGATSRATAERSIDEYNKAISKPNTYAWRSISVSSMSSVSASMTLSGNMYGLNAGTGNQFDSMLLKNTQWGAITYLANSKYGNTTIWSNPNSSSLTGCAGNIAKATTTATCNAYNTPNGIRASTTGNVYGVYDMAGGSSEYVMGVFRPTDTTNISDSSGFNITNSNGSLPISKYFDRYITSNPTTACNTNICFGHSLSETRSWESSSLTFASSTNPWYARGGNYTSSNSSIFEVSVSQGAGNNNIGFRISLIKKS